MLGCGPCLAALVHAMSTSVSRQDVWIILRTAPYTLPADLQRTVGLLITIIIDILFSTASYKDSEALLLL